MIIPLLLLTSVYDFDTIDIVDTTDLPLFIEGVIGSPFPAFRGKDTVANSM